MKKYIILCAILYCWLTNNIAIAQTTTATSPQLKSALDKFAQSPNLRHASWGFSARKTTDNTVVAAYNAEKSLKPASTLKLLTTAVALNLLGEDYTYTTLLQYDGHIDHGTLCGNLYIKGGGDPTLGTWRNNFGTGCEAVLQQWVKAVQQAGIRRIEGAVIGDASFFDTETIPPQWMWEDMGNYYGAGASGLSFRENQCDVVLSSGKTGSAVTLKNTIPPLPNVTLINELVAGAAGSGDEAYCFLAPYSLVGFLRGTIPPQRSSFTVRIAVPDPALSCAQQLQNALAQSGISAATPVTTQSQTTASKSNARQTLHSLASPPVSEIVFWTNKRSINLYAEHLLKTIGKTKYAQPTYAKGIEAVKSFMSERGIPTDGLLLQDGSGLSPLNAITADQLAILLRKMTADKQHYDSFFRSLAIAGDPTDVGFQKGLLDGTAAAKRVWVKSGYIGNSRSYAGYLKTLKNTTIAFSLIVNNYTCTNTQMKNEMENLLTALVQYGE